MTDEARQAILASIRSHLATSVAFDRLEHEPVDSETPVLSSTKPSLSPVEQFKQNLEAVGAHCLIAQSRAEIVRALTQIIGALQKTELRAQRIAISDAPAVERLLFQTDLEIEELAVAPNAKDIFNFDAGITGAQAAIAETGTLILDSAHERHRLVSLVPPVHIAIVEAAKIYGTLDEALNALHSGNEVSPAVTFITGPSRTADIELTLTIGVHGPQELYVIVDATQTGKPFGQD